MVHLLTVATVSSVVLSSLAPGAQAAPAMPPLPMRQEARRSMLNSGDMDLEKRDLKIKGGFDPDHSLHWNYHHGYASEDGHGHGWHGAKQRRTIDLEAIIQLNSKAQKQDKRSLLGLNLGGKDGILGNKDNKGLLGTKGLGLNLRKERRAVDEDEDEEEYDEELEKRSPEPRSSRHRHGRYRHRHDRHSHGDHVHIHSHKRDEIEARDPRRHHHHHDDHSDHVHIHSHSHKRDEIVEEEELEKRSKSEPKRFERKSKKSKGKKSSKSGKSFKKTDSKNSKKSKSKGSSSKSKSSDKKNKKNAAPSSSSSESKPAVSAKVSLGKRGLEQAGVPGFVEVATPLFNSSLARTVAGLVFTANPDPSPNATTFVLGTSDAESTQFYLTTASNPDPSTPVELNVVNIRVPILDSQTLKVVDYCATFDLTPPSPLSLLPCGKKDGFSQNFAYNGTTGEVQPLYSTTPAPMALVSNKASQASTSGAQSFAATDSNSTATAQPEEDPEDISLYFIPASTYYEAPSHVDNLIDSHKNRTLAASMSSSDEGMTATSTMDEAQPSSTDLPTSTDSSSAADATMTAAPMADDGSSTDAMNDDYSNMDSSSASMDGETSMDDSSSSSSSMDDSMMMTQDSMDPMATPTDSFSTDEPLSTSTVEPSASSTPLVNQNNAATPSSSMMASSSSATSMPMASSSASSASSSSMTPSGTPSGSMSGSASASSISTSSSANASPTVTIQSTDYTTPGMTSDPNAGIDANASNYSPMKMARRRFARW
ncbi:hypothetical protein JCM3765_001855 [Sporobolomyces pararoseus]